MNQLQLTNKKKSEERDPTKFLDQKRKSYFHFGKTARKKQYDYPNKLKCVIELEERKKDKHNRFELNKDSNFMTKEIVSDDEMDIDLNTSELNNSYLNFITNERKETNINNYDFGRKPLMRLSDYYNDYLKIVLVGNKTDRVDHRVISTEDGKILASKLNIDFYETNSNFSMIAHIE